MRLFFIYKFFNKFVGKSANTKAKMTMATLLNTSLSAIKSRFGK